MITKKATQKGMGTGACDAWGSNSVKFEESFAISKKLFWLLRLVFDRLGIGLVRLGRQSGRLKDRLIQP